MSKNYNTKTASLKATIADIRNLDAKQIDAENINLKNKNILEYIEESVPTITHSQDTRETVYMDDLWGQWVETRDHGTIVIHDDYLTNPNASSYTPWLSNVKAVQNNKAYSEITTDTEGNFTGVDESSVVANIQTEMIKDGFIMFLATSLTSFSGDLNNLVNGVSMFEKTSLASFSGDLSSLTNGDGMFKYTSLTSFSGDLSNLINGSYMFGSSSLTSFSGDLSNLVNGKGMFEDTSLTSFSGDLSSLTDGSFMFDSSDLASFSGDLSNLVDGSNMFYWTPLTSFISNLSSLTNGSKMFQLTSLKSFNNDLSSLVKGSYMFGSNTSLKSFNSDLSSLVDGSSMFSSNTSFESFSGDLNSLVNGSYMFTKCKLSPQSVMYIVESIRNITEEKAKYTSGEIPWITYDSTAKKYSAPFGFMEDGEYVYTYNYYKKYYTTTVYASNVGKLTLGIDVTNNADTISDQLQTFAEECLYESWAKLKEAFINKGWTVTFQYGGSDSSISLSDDEQFRGVPVYARLIEVSEEDKDRAEYCTEDGTKFYNIAWGHDVTDYDSYQYFGSLLEACGYFGVIPVKYLEEN